MNYLSCQYLSLKEFVEKYRLKNEATSKVKIKEILDKLTIPAGIYMGDDKFTTTSGIVNLHPTKGTHWVMFVNEFYFDSYGCPTPTNILNHIKKRYLFKISIVYVFIVYMFYMFICIVYMFYMSHKL